MTADAYIRFSCPNCESSYAVDYLIQEAHGTAEYCPFCGEEIPVEEQEELEEDEEETDSSW